jgi:phage N-6-adenine-methyltransferase
MEEKTVKPHRNKLSDLMFSSKSDEWHTPKKLFDQLNKIHNFDIDVCATRENTLCTVFMNKEIDALNQNWSEFSKKYIGERKPVCFMNPPYNRKLMAKFIKKALEEALNGVKTVCLLPSRTDTRWFHEYCTKGKITFLKGRLKFSDNRYNAPFPSMIVIFEPKNQ